MREKLDLSFTGPQRTLNPRFQMIIRLNHRQGAHDQRHFSFKDAKDYLHHVGRPLIPFSLSTHPHSPHGRMWPSYLRISHRKSLFFSLLVFPPLPFLLVPTIHPWHVVKHKSGIIAEPWWLCSFSGWSSKAATVWRSQPGFGTRIWLVQGTLQTGTNW